jgi:hypothetical protein
MLDVVFVILWILCSMSAWVIYHKLFNVLYFDFFNGCVKEIITSGVVGAVLAAIIIRFWYIAIIIIILVCVAIFKKN